MSMRMSMRMSMIRSRENFQTDLFVRRFRRCTQILPFLIGEISVVCGFDNANPFARPIHSTKTSGEPLVYG